MHELRLVAVSEDGSYAVLVVPGRSGRFSLQIDDRLRAVARGQFSRLAQYEIEVESPLRPKEIQERIRAGETADEIADAAGIPVERVRWFEGPVLAERAYRAQEAQSAMVRRPGDSGPGPRLGEMVTQRLGALGTSPEDARWDSTKRGDGNWQIQLVFATTNGSRTAHWVYDPRRKHAVPVDDSAAVLSLPEVDLPADLGGAHGRATVTPLQPRLSPPAAPPARHGRVTEPPPAPPERSAASPQPPEEERRPRPVRHRAAQPAPSAEQDAKPAERTHDGPADQVPTAPAQGADAQPVQADEPERAPVAQASRRAASGRGRRSSVPSWDEIMFGSTRPRD
jgi:hypothetical protein